MGTALPVEMRLFQTVPEPTKFYSLIEEKWKAQCYKAQNDKDEDKRRDVPSYLLCFFIVYSMRFFLAFWVIGQNVLMETALQLDK